MSNSNDRSPGNLSKKLTYSVAVLSVALAFIVVRAMEAYFTPTPATLFLCAILISALLGGIGPGSLAVTASILIFDYFYIRPRYSFGIEIKEVPRFLMFSFTAIFVGALGMAQNASIKSLRCAYGKLANAIKALRQTNQTLEHENAKRKKIHERLHFSEALLNEGQKISHTGSWRWTTSSNELIWSDEHYRIFGYEVTHGPATPDMFLERVHPEDERHVREIAGRAMQEHTTFEFEYRIILPDGNIRYLRAVGCPIAPGSPNCDKYIGTTVDITFLKKAEQKLEESQRLLRQLADRSETVREEERKHLARELHDDLAQHLSALRMKIAIINMEFGQQSPALSKEIQSMVSLVDSTIKMTRHAITSLRPAALDMGIASALEWLQNEFVAQSGIYCVLTIGATDNALKDHTATAIFRIAQESLRNVAKHAKANNVDIRFERRNNAYVLKIADDGMGFDPAVKKDETFGLLGIQERVLMLGGTVDIKTEPGRGTVIQVSIPVPQAVTAP
jgi:PAS domain S-box-containing protein